MFYLWVYYGYVTQKTCPVCNKVISSKRTFCSVECKSKSQIKRIELVCVGCSVSFKIRPYLKRKTNYCSVDCYYRSTKTRIIKICPECGKIFEALICKTNRGQVIHCSQDCYDRSLVSHRKIQTCNQCGKIFTRALSLSIKYPKAFCSKKCCDDSVRVYVSITCVNCQKIIKIPQSTINRGKGRFCSWYCYTHFKGETSIEKLVRIQLQKTKIPFEQEVKIGKYHADFLITSSKMVIECDGDYWHGLPQAIKKDATRSMFLKQKGYKVVHFSETEIKRTKGKCIHGLISS